MCRGRGICLVVEPGLMKQIIEKLRNENEDKTTQMTQSFKRPLLCFVDFRKAFDKVNHKLLWEKINSYEAGGKFLDIIKSMYTKGNQLSFMLYPSGCT